MASRKQDVKEKEAGFGLAGSGGGEVAPGSTSRAIQKSDAGGLATKTASSSTRGIAAGGRIAAGSGGGGGGSGSEKVIRYKTCMRNTIADVLRTRGWQEVKEGETDWDFYWCDVAWMREHFDQTYLDEHQKVCHFRNHYELTRFVSVRNKFIHS